MKFGSTLWLLAALSLPALDSQAQQTSATTSPYTQSRTQGYTSFDNPYAPGGIYDPYRGSLSSRTQRKTQSGPEPDFADIDADADNAPCASNLPSQSGLAGNVMERNDSYGSNSKPSNSTRSIARLNRLPNDGRVPGGCMTMANPARKRKTGIGAKAAANAQSLR